jgi:DNA-binding transcriptional regulator YhcF (GntR family)
MPWDFDNSLPIYLQIMDKIKLKIISGKYRSGEKLPSVRELAQEAGVNPNTMQRALFELEREGLFFSVRTSGRFVTEDEQLIGALRHNLAMEKISEFFESLKALGYSTTEIKQIIDENIKLLEKGE